MVDLLKDEDFDLLYQKWDRAWEELSNNVGVTMELPKQRFFYTNEVHGKLSHT